MTSVNNGRTPGNKSLWEFKSKDYPFHARMSLLGGPKPHEVDDFKYGHFLTVPINQVRMWGFKTEEARNEFAAKHGATKLVP